jgi:hypothetical protein
MESEPTTWRGVNAHWKEGRGQVRETSCEIFRSCDSICANVPLRTAVRHADCDRHELVRTIKLCANCDVALATVRCSCLIELQMGDLHEKVPRSRRRYDPESYSLRASKVYLIFVLDLKMDRQSRSWAYIVRSQNRGGYCTLHVPKVLP